SLVLVVAAGLFVRTFTSLANVQLGFELDRVLIVNMNTLGTQIAVDDRGPTYERARQAVLALPGVAAAAVSAINVVMGQTWNGRIRVSDQVELSERQNVTNFNAITPGWLTTYGTRLLAGRDVTDRDTAAGARVALVNEAFARRFLNGANPIGHALQSTVGFNP